MGCHRAAYPAAQGTGQSTLATSGRDRSGDEIAGADRRLAEVKLELATIDKQLALSAEHWRTLAVTSHMLEQVCEIYETERQPKRFASFSVLETTDRGQIHPRLDSHLARTRSESTMTNNRAPLEVLSRGHAKRSSSLSDFRWRPPTRGAVLPCHWCWMTCW